MSVPMTKVLMTAEQFLAFDFGDENGLTKWELLEGTVVVSEPLPIHELVRTNLAYEFEAWRRAGEGRGRFLLNIDTGLDEHNLLAPDAQWYPENRPVADLYDRPNPPGDIVIEVLSPSTSRRDIIVKRRVYARMDVREYWIVDPPGRRVHLLRDPDVDVEGYLDERILEEDEALTSRRLPGFAVLVADLFR